MNKPTILVDAFTQVDFPLRVIQNFFVDGNTGNNNHQVISISKSLKEYSRQFDHDLVEDVRVPLGHITLATELLGSLSREKDLKLCLDVIRRNSTRINKLVNEFDSFLQIEGVKTEKIYFH